ncbi:MAG: hypothetical protein IKK70_01270 [Clostridia bacterium]|nr:hypothetical protein [Clostridia bacterium]
MTGNEIYSASLDLLGLKGEDGSERGDTADLRARALSLLNLLLAECSIIDCRIRRCEHSVLSVASLDETLPCSDIIASSALPYGLASMLVSGEDEDLATSLLRLYYDARKQAITFGIARRHPITEVYK